MKVLVTGIGGQLGYDLMKLLPLRGIEASGTSSRDMDITDEISVRQVMDEVRPDGVIHCAAWTKVDLAEDHEAECRQVNAHGTEILARAAAEYGAKFMYFSTDYVFDGEGERPHRPEDPTDPLGVYGLTKLEGEKAVLDICPDRFFILRLQWVYGINGHNFPKTMLKLARTHESVGVVSDQIGSPSYTPDIAGLAADMIVSEEYGIYHVANEGYCSWYDFARAVFAEAGFHTEVRPLSSDEYPTRAVRPHNSRFDTSKLEEHGFSLLPTWRDALKRYIAELREAEPELFCLPG